MIRLLDVNVLLALGWPQHVHHVRAIQWVDSERGRGKLSIATCPLTQLGFLRISMNVKGYAADFESASALLTSLVQNKNFDHTFWPDDISIIAEKMRSDLGPNQITDAYLVALAEKRADASLVTFDQGIKGQNIEAI
jgi:hypothetical protein